MSYREISTDPELVHAVKDLSDRLECDLDEDTLKVLVELLELGLQPEPLARVVRDLEIQRLTLQADERKKQAADATCAGKSKSG